MERTVELHALLREMLLLRHDAVHVVVAHLQPVGSGLAVRSGIGSRSTCQTVECVIRIGMSIGPPAFPLSGSAALLATLSTLLTAS